MVRDFAALNGFESATGDAWGLAFVEDPAITAEDLARLDRAAALAATDDELAARRALYAALWRHGPGERVRLEVMREERLERVEVMTQDRSDFYASERRGSGDPSAG